MARRNAFERMNNTAARRITQWFYASAVGLFLVLVVPLQAIAYEQQPISVDPGGEFQEGSELGALEETGNCLGGNNPNACGGLTFLRGGPVDIAAQIINLLLSVLGVFSLFLIVYAGWTWMLARGNQEKIEKAKEIIIGTVIGLFVILASYAFLQVVFQRILQITEAPLFF